jgi:Rod binding domain-containing protein
MNTIGPNSVPPSPLGASPEALAAQAKSGDARAPDRVAAEFESMIVSMVLKEMRQTLEPGTLFGEDSSDSYGGIFDLYLGKHLADAGGFGVSGMVKRYLEVAQNNGNTKPSQLTR